MTFDGTNYSEFVGFFRIHMRDIRLWGVLSGRFPVRRARFLVWLLLRLRHHLLMRMHLRLLRMQLSLPMSLQLVLMSNRFSSMRSLFTFTVMLSLLTLSGLMMMLVLRLFSLPVFCLSLPLRSGDALCLSVVRQAHALQQGDSIIDDFYAQSFAIWRQLDSLCTAGCRTCKCCQAVRTDLEFHRVYEVLFRLRP